MTLVERILQGVTHPPKEPLNPFSPRPPAESQKRSRKIEPKSDHYVGITNLVKGSSGVTRFCVFADYDANSLDELEPLWERLQEKYALGTVYLIATRNDDAHYWAYSPTLLTRDKYWTLLLDSKCDPFYMLAFAKKGRSVLRLTRKLHQPEHANCPHVAQTLTNMHLSRDRAWVHSLTFKNYFKLKGVGVEAVWQSYEPEFTWYKEVGGKGRFDWHSYGRLVQALAAIRHHCNEPFNLRTGKIARRASVKALTEKRRST